MTENSNSSPVNTIPELQKADLDKIVTENNSQEQLHHLESELRMTLEEIARLQKALADANMKISALRIGTHPLSSSHLKDRELYTSLLKELEQPVEMIHNYCSLLLGESIGLLGGLQRKFIERIETSATNIHAILDDLTRSNSVTKKGFFEVQTFSASELLDQVVTSVAETLREKQITLGVEIADDLPDFVGDRDVLEQIFQMLLTNAVQATPEDGSIQVAFSKEMDEGRDSIVLSVQNSGDPINPEDLAQLFTYRIQDNGNQIAGLGISQKEIAILKMLVQEQNGKLNVLSEPFQGTTFLVQFQIIAAT